MLVLSLNEHEDAERYLEDKICDNNIFNKLRVIARYYLDNGYSKRDAESMVREYVAQCGESPSLNYWSDMIDSAMKRAVKTKAILIDNITVYQSELDKINALEGTQLKRLAFTLLCLAKYRDALSPNNNHWINYQISEVMKLANIKTSIKNQCALYRKLMLGGYLVMPEKAASTSAQILLVDGEGDEALQVTDMRNLGFQYLKYCGEPYFECENCGLTVKIKNKDYYAGRPQKYCDRCAAIIIAKQKTEYVMRLRPSS